MVAPGGGAVSYERGTPVSGLRSRLTPVPSVPMRGGHGGVEGRRRRRLQLALRLLLPVHENEVNGSDY